LQTHGNTALFDAVYLGLEKLSRGAFAKRAMIVISDGEDNHSLYTFNELRRHLQESDVAIYTIQIGIPLVRRGASNRMGELAAISGGKAYPPANRRGMCDAFEQIALELRQQYSLAFFPSGLSTDSVKRHIRILVTPPVGSPRLAVRHRKAYLSAKESGE
jgi:Ca-activated chloride channel family protein